MASRKFIFSAVFGVAVIALATSAAIVLSSDDAPAAQDDPTPTPNASPEESDDVDMHQLLDERIKERKQAEQDSAPLLP